MREISAINALPFYTSINHQARNAKGCGVACNVGILSPVNKLPNFQIFSPSDIATGAFKIYNACDNVAQFDIADTLIKKAQLTNGNYVYQYMGLVLQFPLPYGWYYVSFNNGEFVSEIIEIGCPTIEIQYWNETDLGGTLYQYGSGFPRFINNIYLDGYEDSNTIDVQEDIIFLGNGKEVVKSATHIERRNLKLHRIFDSMLAAFSNIKLHSNIVIKDEGSPAYKPIDNFNFSSDSATACLNVGTLSFAKSIVIKDGCGQNEYSIMP